jgi:hypothetical protein
MGLGKGLKVAQALEFAVSGPSQVRDGGQAALRSKRGAFLRLTPIPIRLASSPHLWCVAEGAKRSDASRHGWGP